MADTYIKFNQLGNTTNLDKLLGVAQDTNGSTPGVKVIYSNETDLGGEDTSDAKISTQKSVKAYVDGIDANLVHKTGNETISGTKSFNGEINLPNETTGSFLITDENKNVTTGDKVDFANSSAGQVLEFNGTTWKPADKGALVGNGINFYLTDTALIQKGTQSAYAVKELSKTPALTTSTEESTIVNNNTDIILAFLYDTSLKIDKITGGSWQETIWRKASDITGNNYIKTGAYIVQYQSSTITITGTGTTRTATATNSPFIVGDANSDLTLCSYLATPTGLFNIVGYTDANTVTISTTSTYVNETSAVFYKWHKILTFVTSPIKDINISLDWVDPINTDNITTNLNDKFGVIFFAQTDNTTDTTISFVHGNSTTDTYLITPLVTGHNQLPGVQGGNIANNDVQHLTTPEVNLLPNTNQKAALNAANNPSSTNAFATIADLNNVDVNQLNILYVAKAGNDINDGTTLNKAVYSCQSGVVLATTKSPILTKQYVVYRQDAAYDSNVYLIPFVHLLAPSMRLTGYNSCGDNSSITVRELHDNDTVMDFKNGTTTGVAYLTADEWSSGKIILQANNGIRFLTIKNADFGSNSTNGLIIYSGSKAIINAGIMRMNIQLDGTTSYIDITNIAEADLTFTYTNGATSLQIINNKLQKDSNNNVTANSFIGNFETNTTTGTTSLTNASAPNQEFTGASAKTIFIPIGTSMYISQYFTIINKRTVNIPILLQDGSTLTTVNAGTIVKIICTDNTTNNGTWDIVILKGTSGHSFITSGTSYTTPATITTNTQFKITLIGGGAGSAGVQAGSGNKSAGAGGGATGIVYLTGLTPSTAYTIAIGAAGTAGASTPTNGGNGGDTTFTANGVTYTASGGHGSVVGINTSGGLGGTATNCTININGQAGCGVGGADTGTTSGYGGDSGLGFGLGAVGVQGANAGLAGTGYGAGASGASSNGSNHAGNTGTAGCILIEYWN